MTAEGEPGVCMCAKGEVMCEIDATLARSSTEARAENIK